MGLGRRIHSNRPHRFAVLGNMALGQKTSGVRKIMFKWLFTDEFMERRKKAKADGKDKSSTSGFLSNLYKNFTATITTDSSNHTVISNGKSFNRTVKNNNETISINGKKLTPGTPEYQKTKEYLNGTFKKSMDDFEKEMRDMAKEIKNIFKD